MKKLFALAAACFLFAAGISFEARAADFPKRPVTIIVPWGAGGGSDLIARSLAKPLEKQLGKPVIINNKPGGSGTVGTSYVAHAKPDGYTIGLINSTGLIHQIHYGGLDYKKEDLAPLALILRAPVFLVVKSDSPIKNLNDFVQAAKDKDGQLTLGTAAVGGGTHMAIAPFFDKAGIKVQPMPFKGGGSGVMTALIGGHIDSAVAHPSEIAGQYKAGNIRILGVLDGDRLTGYENVPTFKEQGYDVTGDVWRCFMAPKDTPPEVKEILVKALETAVKDQGYLDALSKLGDLPTWMGPEDFQKFLAQEDQIMLDTIKRLNMHKKNVQ